MKTIAIAIVVAFACLMNGLAPVGSLAQERVRIGVPLFPTVSYPVLIAQEKGFFERNGLKAEIIRINSEPTTYQALISGDIDATSSAPTGLVQSNIQGVPVGMMTCVDKRSASVDRSKLVDYSILKGLAATRQLPVKK